MLVDSCDVDGDGRIDSREWCDRFSAALRRLQAEELTQDVDDESGDVAVAAASISPASLERGEWPGADVWELSDHGYVTATFVPAGPNDGA